MGACPLGLTETPPKAPRHTPKHPWVTPIPQHPFSPETPPL